MVECDLCGAMCRSGVMFQRHLDKHHPEKNISYKCDKCSAMFQDEVFYNINLIDVKLKKKQTMTNLIGKNIIYFQKKYLYHLVNHWESGNKCPCGNKLIKSCDATFIRRAALCAHIEKYHLRNQQV